VSGVPQNATADLTAAISQFQAHLPGWWWSIGMCSVSCHASCGPDRAWQDAHLLTMREFDYGFNADLAQPATCAEALLEAMDLALGARARWAASQEDGA